MFIFLYGEDTYRSRQKLKEFRDKFNREIDPSGRSFAVVDGEAATAEKLNEAISPASLFSKKRMIVIENIFANKSQSVHEQLAAHLEAKKGEGGDDNIVIFIDNISAGEKLTKAKENLFKILSKQKFAAEFKPLSNTEAMAWTKKAIEGMGAKASHEAIATITSLLGNDLWLISSEIEKIINYKAGQKLRLGEEGKGSTIETDDVLHLVRGQFDENIFALTDAISSRNRSLAVKLFEEQMDAGLTDFYLLSMITRQFRVLMQIRQALDEGETQRKITTQLKLHPFVVQKGINQTRNFSLDTLRSVFIKLVEMDYLAKTGEGDIKTMLSMMIAKI